MIFKPGTIRTFWDKSPIWIIVKVHFLIAQLLSSCDSKEVTGMMVTLIPSDLNGYRVLPLCTLVSLIGLIGILPA